jgi:hypothetical protein
MNTRPSEIIFAVEEAPEGGFVARALGHSVFTEADDLEAARRRARCGPLSFQRRRPTQGDPSASRAGGSLCGMRLPGFQGRTLRCELNGEQRHESSAGIRDLEGSNFIEAMVREGLPRDRAV